ncbi:MULTISPECIES: hypothetical protein [unclassified Phenylobacterium]|uniref:hypothetical protein n=1 Tax=unclassified Phenylobacterium TaxID=2640670 RepID=UPI00083A3199|nr:MULTISPECIES: hypothetical protein [unclassified Phenylobacterium]
MPRLSYVNERADEALVVIEPWSQAARVAPGGRIDITFDASTLGAGEIRVSHRADNEILITLDIALVSISGERVTNLGAREDPVP